MLIIKNNLEGYKEVNKSKFYTYIFRLEKAEDCKFYLNKIKSLHPKARHFLHLYLIASNKLEANEDKEPVQSMHKALQNLERKGVGEILIIIVRYFGGVLLGAGNLDRTYTSCIFDLLTDDKLEEKRDKITYKVWLKNSAWVKFQSLMTGDIEVVEKEFIGGEVRLLIKTVYLEDRLASLCLKMEEVS